MDLKLLPMTFLRDDCAFSYTVIPVNRCTELFEELMRLSDLTVPGTFNTYLGSRTDPDESSGNTQETPYGEPLTYVLARDLLRFKDHEGVRDFNNAGA